MDVSFHERPLPDHADAGTVANYARRVLGQTGGGHVSPLAAWEPERDLVLVLELWDAMSALDAATERPRGWLEIDRAAGSAWPPPGAEDRVKRIRAVGGSCPLVPGTT